MTIRDAFTCAATVGVLGLILSPLLSTGRAAAYDPDPLCASRSASVAAAILLYTDANDGKVPLAAYKSTDFPTTVNSRMWPYLVLPFHGDWNAYRCSACSHATTEILSVFEGTQATPATLPNFMSIYSNRGYNWLYLSPSVTYTGQPGTGAGCFPISSSMIASEATTIVFTESIWDRTSAGRPQGAGLYIVDAPCIRDSNGNINLPFPSGMTQYWWLGGWRPTAPLAWNVYGGTWPWHRDHTTGQKDKLAQVAFADGHVSIIGMTQLAAGCDLQDAGAGRILDSEAYLWDLD